MTTAQIQKKLHQIEIAAVRAAAWSAGSVGSFNGQTVECKLSPRGQAMWTLNGKRLGKQQLTKALTA